MESTTETLFGVLAVQEGFASEAEVEVALVAQKEAGAEVGGVEARIGQILLEMGALNQAQIDAVLAAQTRFRAASGLPEMVFEMSPEVPAPPVRATASPRLVQESGGSPRINGDLVTGPALLKPGDTIQLGDARFRFEGDLGTAPLIVPPMAVVRPAAPVAESSTAVDVSKAETVATPVATESVPEAIAAPAAPAGPSVVRRILGDADRLVSKVLPKVHNHRKYIVAAAFLGILAIVLPWRIAQNDNTVVGLQGPGWLTFWLLSIAAGTAALTWVARPLAKLEWIVIASSSGLALLASIWKFAAAPAWAKSRGVGLYLTLFSAIAVHAVAWLVRKSASGSVAEETGSAPAGVRLGRVLHKFIRNFSGASAKEKVAQIQRRDELLVQIGRLAVTAKVEGPEAAAAVEAGTKATAAEAAAKTDPKARASFKISEGKAKRALGKLGRHVVDKSIALTEGQAMVDELKALEEKIGKEA